MRLRLKSKKLRTLHLKYIWNLRRYNWVENDPTGLARLFPLAIVFSKLQSVSFRSTLSFIVPFDFAFYFVFVSRSLHLFLVLSFMSVLCWLLLVNWKTCITISLRFVTLFLFLSITRLFVIVEFVRSVSRSVSLPRCFCSWLAKNVLYNEMKFEETSLP